MNKYKENEEFYGPSFKNFQINPPKEKGEKVPMCPIKGCPNRLEDCLRAGTGEGDNENKTEDRKL